MILCRSSAQEFDGVKFYTDQLRSKSPFDVGHYPNTVRSSQSNTAFVVARLFLRVGQVQGWQLFLGVKKCGLQDLCIILVTVDDSNNANVITLLAIEVTINCSYVELVKLEMCVICGIRYIKLLCSRMLFIYVDLVALKVEGWRNGG